MPELSGKQPSCSNHHTAISLVATKIGVTSLRTSVPDQVAAALTREPLHVGEQFNGWYRSRFELYAVGLFAQRIV